MCQGKAETETCDLGMGRVLETEKEVHEAERYFLLLLFEAKVAASAKTRRRQSLDVEV